MSDIIRNDRASTYFTTCARRRGYCNEMWYIVRDKYIPPDEVVIFKQVLAMIYPQDDCSCYIQCCTTTDTDNCVAVSLIVNSCSIVYIRLYRILMNVAEY